MFIVNRNMSRKIEDLDKKLKIEASLIFSSKRETSALFLAPVIESSKTEELAI
jgi:hypothetical protein